jgi:hypothetical protein
LQHGQKAAESMKANMDGKAATMFTFMLSAVVG